MSYQWKRDAQEFLWILIMLLLFIGVNLVWCPVVAKLLFKQLPSGLEKLYSGKMIFGFVIGFVTLIWWVCRGKHYESRSRK